MWQQRVAKFGSTKAIRGFQGGLYRELQTGERPLFDEYAKGRLQSRDLNYEIVQQNLARLPATMPPTHRMTIFRFIFNGIGTSSRHRFIPNVEVLPCPFCASPQQDSQSHWASCPTLQQAFATIYGNDAAQELWCAQTLSLQASLGGDLIQRLGATMFAVWRCRCIRVRGFKHAGSDDFIRHLRQLVEDPWIRGDQTSTKSERRAARMQPPPRNAKLHRI